MTNTFWQPKNKLSIWAIHNDDGDLGKEEDAYFKERIKKFKDVGYTQVRKGSNIATNKKGDWKFIDDRDAIVSE